MARTRTKEKPREGSGRLATAAALLFLIVVGFTVGMLAGLALVTANHQLRAPDLFRPRAAPPGHRVRPVAHRQ